MENSKRRVVGIKTEATHEAGATLAATDYMLADLEYPEQQLELLKRDYMRASLDPLPHVVGKRTSGMKIKTELKGSGTPGTAYAPLGAALLMCGMTETISPGVSVTYAPTSTPATNFYSPGKTAAVHGFLGGQKHVQNGSVANCKITAEVNKIPLVEFDTKGVYVAPSTTAFPSTTYLAALPVAWQNSTILVHSYAAIVKKWEIDFGNSIQLSEDPTTGKNGVGYFFVAGKEPKVSIQIEQSLLATFNPFTIQGAGTQASCSFTIGTVAGNIITITMPKVQIGEGKYSDHNGILCYDLPLHPAMNSGDDWISIVIT